MEVSPFQLDQNDMVPLTSSKRSSSRVSGKILVRRSSRVTVGSDYLGQAGHYSTIIDTIKNQIKQQPKKKKMPPLPLRQTANFSTIQN